MQGTVGKLLIKGIDYALADFEQIAKGRLGRCVKPKEDQLKCAIYRAFSEAGYVVHVEPSYERAGGECDLIVADTKPIAIEIKTAWGGTTADGWQNKSSEQHGDWLKDISRLDSLSRDTYQAGVFVLLFAYEEGSDGEELVRAKIAKLQPAYFRSKIIDIGNWNGLNKAECSLIQVF